MRVVVVLQLRHACILECNSSTYMITLASKGNKLMGVGIRIKDDNVYVIPRKLSCEGNKLLGVGIRIRDANVYVIPCKLSLFFN